jgi:hypothetical protein
MAFKIESKWTEDDPHITHYRISKSGNNYNLIIDDTDSSRYGRSINSASVNGIYYDGDFSFDGVYNLEGVVNKIEEDIIRMKKERKEYGSYEKWKNLINRFI